MKKKIDLSELMEKGSRKKGSTKKGKTRKEKKVTKNQIEKKTAKKENTDKKKSPEPKPAEVKEKKTNAVSVGDSEMMQDMASVLKKENVDELTETREFVGFLLGDEEYGIDSDYVRQIIKYKKPLDVGVKSKFIKGILNTKEGVLPVLDIRSRFNLNDEKTEDGSIIILDCNDLRIGIFVNYLIGIIRIEADKVKNIPSFLPEYQMMLISSIGIKENDKIIIILDHNKILDANDMKEIKSLPEDYK